jgi:ABC-type branched-subunit amino acid transport system ATPase component
MELTDRVTVLRDGQWVKTAPTAILDGESIAQLMVGRELSSLYPAKTEPDVDEAIVLSVNSVSTHYVKDASFEVRKGEILGFSGLIGSGRTELMEAVVGLRLRASGEVVIRGETVPSGDVHAANRCGLAYMTKDRKSKGLLLNSNMTANLTLQSLDQHGKLGYLSPASEAKALDKARRRFDIRVRDGNIVAGRMSGGNQQKLLLAKVMETEPQIIIIARHRCRHQAADLSFHLGARPRWALYHRRVVGNARDHRALHAGRGDARRADRRRTRGRRDLRAGNHALFGGTEKEGRRLKRGAVGVAIRQRIAGAISRDGGRLWL